MELQQNGKRVIISRSLIFGRITDQGIFLVGVAQFGLGKSTIIDLQRDKKNIEKFSAESADPSGLKKRCSSGETMINIL